jgi:hypothetical protein
MHVHILAVFTGSCIEDVYHVVVFYLLVDLNFLHAVVVPLGLFVFKSVYRFKCKSGLMVKFELLVKLLSKLLDLFIDPLFHHINFL